MKPEMKILMLEDDVHDAELIKGELRKGCLSFRARRVDTRQAFTEFLMHDTPDLIISDHGLPSFNGFEAMAMAKQNCPDIPFVFVTGLNENDSEIEMFERTAMNYVLKSQLSRLIPVIHRATHEAEKRRERRKHEPKVHHAENHFRTLLDSVRGYAICQLDVDGCVSSWNAGVSWIKADEAGDIIGKHFSCFYPAEAVTNGQPAHALAQAIAHGFFEEETVLLRMRGVLFWAEVAIAPLRDGPENLRGFALVMHDITARKESEAERERLIRELQSTLHDVKILSGLMPICPSCKKVRDYKGQWHPLEIYLQTRSEVTLVHEFCEECARHITPAGGESPGHVL